MSVFCSHPPRKKAKFPTVVFDGIVAICFSSELLSVSLQDEIGQNIFWDKCCIQANVSVVGNLHIWWQMLFLPLETTASWGELKRWNYIMQTDFVNSSMSLNIWDIIGCSNMEEQQQTTMVFLQTGPGFTAREYLQPIYCYDLVQMYFIKCFDRLSVRLMFVTYKQLDFAIHSQY